MWARENNGQAAVVTVCVIERDKPMCVYTDRSQLALTMLQLIVFRIFGRFIGGRGLTSFCLGTILGQSEIQLGTLRAQK